MAKIGTDLELGILDRCLIDTLELPKGKIIRHKFLPTDKFGSIQVGSFELLNYHPRTLCSSLKKKNHFNEVRVAKSKLALSLGMLIIRHAIKKNGRRPFKS